MPVISRDLSRILTNDINEKLTTYSIYDNILLCYHLPLPSLSLQSFYILKVFYTNEDYGNRHDVH